MGVVWFVWFGMLLGFEATSLLTMMMSDCFLMHGVFDAVCWGWLLVVVVWGSWCFGVCPVFAAGMPGDDGLCGLLLGCVGGGVGLLFGNCIVNASILQMR